jgi:ABC-type uncharacterized transport system substrate-binding protein
MPMAGKSQPRQPVRVPRVTVAASFGETGRKSLSGWFAEVESYRRPGGNLTGTTNQAIESAGKAWEILRELRPGAQRLGVLWDDRRSGESWTSHARESGAATASKLGLERVEIVVARNACFAKSSARSSPRTSTFS